MSDEQDRLPLLMQLIEELEDLLSRLSVEVTCGLVRQDQSWIIDESARDRGALLLTTGQFRGQVMHAITKAHSLSEVTRATFSFGIGLILIEDRDEDVLQ